MDAVDRDIGARACLWATPFTNNPLPTSYAHAVIWPNGVPLYFFCTS